jgi:hypothetical protein
MCSDRASWASAGRGEFDHHSADSLLRSLDSFSQVHVLQVVKAFIGAWTGALAHDNVRLDSRYVAGDLLTCLPNLYLAMSRACGTGMHYTYSTGALEIEKQAYLKVCCSPATAGSAHGWYGGSGDLAVNQDGREEWERGGRALEQSCTLACCI